MARNLIKYLCGDKKPKRYERLPMKRRILIAENNEYLIDSMRANLGSQDYDVYSANDGEKAWELIIDTKPDLVVLDNQLSLRNGYQLCRRIKSDDELNDIIVVVLIEQLSLEKDPAALECGADEYLAKPCDANVVELLINRKMTDKLIRHQMHPVVGLPLMSVFNNEKVKRYREGKEFAILTLYYKNDCLGILEAVNGKLWSIQVRKKTAQMVKESMAGLEKYNAFGTFSETDKFHIILEMGKNKAIETAKEIANYINTGLLRIHYKDALALFQNTELSYSRLLIACQLEMYNMQKDTVVNL
jgi:CheY-like chemotaxis protein